MYEPKPLQTSSIPLPPELEPLVERLAEHVHDVWAQQRIDDGWTLGPDRNDAAKTHPSLIPYDELSESEKAYDRNTASQTIKALIAWGVKIEFGSLDVAGFTDLDATQQAALADWLPDELPTDPAALASLWESRPMNIARLPADLYCRLAQRFLNAGEPVAAYDVIDAGLQQHPQHIRMRQLFGLALNRSGASERACEVMEALLADAGSRDDHPIGETLGILARAHKTLAQQATDADEQQRQYAQSYERYFEGFNRAKDQNDVDGQIYTGINAATVLLLIGRVDESKALASEVFTISENAGKGAGAANYWTVATLAEACLLQGDLQQAETFYRQAAGLAGQNWSMPASTRPQAKAILKAQGHDPTVVDAWLPVPPIVVFRGHMMDRPGQSPRLTPEIEPVIRQQISDMLDRIDPQIGYTAAACGSDIIFAEEMIKRGRSLQIVLPYSVEEFIESSVAFAGEDWVKRFHAVLAATGQPMIASPHRPKDSDIVFRYANQILLGRAMLRARSLDASVAGIIVWDGQQGRSSGGVSAMADACRQRGVPINQIEITPTETNKTARQPSDDEQQIRALLFADVKGFSKLGEQELTAFANEYLKSISGVCEEFERDGGLLMKNTWGDGLFFVFRTVRDAALFASQLCDRTALTDWTTRGLSRQLAIRIALHCGPVYVLEHDPILQRRNYLGNHVSQAARIEPITPENHVYASLAFAAIVEADGITDCVCDYVGRTALAKGYGTFPTYHVRRRSASE